MISEDVIVERTEVRCGTIFTDCPVTLGMDTVRKDHFLVWQDARIVFFGDKLAPAQAPHGPSAAQD